VLVLFTERVTGVSVFECVQRFVESVTYLLATGCSMWFALYVNVFINISVLNAIYKVS
jgi:hypothetical protein